VRVLDLFAGCGGFSLGFQQAGFDIAGFVEWWQPAITTFLKNHPDAIHLGNDITKIPDETFRELKSKVDIIVGGPPCQGFSMCGKRDPKDKRNSLYKEFLRAVRVIEPKIVVMENVQGLLSMKLEDKFVIDKIVEDFIQLDYFVSYKVLTASNYGVAQNRKRLILIACKLDLFPHPKNNIKTVIEAISNISQETNAHLFFNTTQEIQEKISHLKQGEKLSRNFNFSRQRLFTNKPSITTKPIFIHPIKDRFLTPRELARLQSFPDSFEFSGTKTSMVKQIGNAVPPLLAQAIAQKIRGVSL